MKRTAILRGLIVGLVVLSGCAGLPASDDGGQTVESVEYPAGTNQTGVTNTSALVASHQTGLSNTSYELTQSQTLEMDNQSQTREMRVVVDDERERFLVTTVERNTTVTTYLDNQTVYAKRTQGNTTDYRVQQTNAQFDTLQSNFTRSQSIGGFLSEVSLNATSVETVNGTTTITYDVTGFAASANASAVEGANLTGRVVVDTAGRVHEMQFRRTDGNRSLVVEYAFDDIGNASVTEPGWVSEAEAEAA